MQLAVLLDSSTLTQRLGAEGMRLVEAPANLLRDESPANDIRAQLVETILNAGRMQTGQQQKVTIRRKRVS